MSDVVIKVENLGKQYRLGAVGTGTIRDDIKRQWALFRGKEDPFMKEGEINIKEKKAQGDYVWALKNINFEVKQGDVLGIIGKNGAGKSTLLKILSKVTSPTTGTVKLKGRVASLLEVGTGFHPELSGRENIFQNGAILGMTKKEIVSKFDEIVAFSGVERYIDTPVKRYSSGMYVRLAFAVAAHLESEILIIDEVLAVGDAEFQKKCLGKMKNVASQGRTVFFVSHNLAAIQNLCTRGILLNSGMINKDGSAHEVIQYYFNLGINRNEKPPIERYRNYDIKEAPVYIKDVYVKGSQKELPTIHMGHRPVIVITIVAKRQIKEANISVAIFNSEGVKTDLSFSWDDNFYLSVEEGTYEVEFFQKEISLPPGRYSLGIGINQSCTAAAWDGINYYPIFEIENQNNVVHWGFRPWAVHHSQGNNWKLTKL